MPVPLDGLVLLLKIAPASNVRYKGRRKVAYLLLYKMLACTDIHDPTLSVASMVNKILKNAVVMDLLS